MRANIHQKNGTQKAVDAFVSVIGAFVHF